MRKRIPFKERTLYPKSFCESIYDYDFAEAYAKGKRLLLFDIDNTLVSHGAPADQKAKAFFERLHSLGFSCCGVSNNKEPRVKSFCDAVGAGYVEQAGKPKRTGFEKALARYGCTPTEAIFFGDQIFTDILGANRAGIESVLVRPVDRSTDEIQIVFKRMLEKPVIRAFFREKGLAICRYFP